MSPSMNLTGPRGHASSALAILVLLVLASGCTAPGAGRFAGPTAVPLDAPNKIGDGDFPLRVKVVQEHGGGPHIVGAPVVVFHIPKPHEAPGVNQLARANATLGGRTGPDGILTVNLEKGQTYSFITHAPNWTQEARHLVKITDEWRTQPLLITVFRLNGTYEAKGGVPPTIRDELPFITIGGASSVRWWAQEIKLHENNASSRQYLFRARDLQAVLRYNAPPGYAELGMRIGLVSETGQQVYWDRFSGIAQPGSPMELRFGLAAPDLALVSTLKNPVLKIGPFSQESVAVPECIPWTLQVDVLFDTAPAPPPRKPYLYYGTSTSDTVPQPLIKC